MREINGSAGGQNWKCPQRYQLISGGGGEPGRDGDERGLIDVTPCQML